MGDQSIQHSSADPNDMAEKASTAQERRKEDRLAENAIEDINLEADSEEVAHPDPDAAHTIENPGG